MNNQQLSVQDQKGRRSSLSRACTCLRRLSTSKIIDVLSQCFKNFLSLINLLSYFGKYRDLIFKHKHKNMAYAWTDSMARF
jgi:hypothetical protein